MKKRTRLWVVYGQLYESHSGKVFKIEPCEGRPNRINVIIYECYNYDADDYGKIMTYDSKDVTDIFEIDLSLYYLNWLDKLHGIFIEIPRVE